MLALYTRISTEIRTRLSREEEGATAVEYGLIVGIIAAVLVVAAIAFGGQLTSILGDIGTTLDNAPTTRTP